MLRTCKMTYLGSLVQLHPEPKVKSVKSQGASRGSAGPQRILWRWIFWRSTKLTACWTWAPCLLVFSLSSAPLLDYRSRDPVTSGLQHSVKSKVAHNSRRFGGILSYVRAKLSFQQQMHYRYCIICIAFWGTALRAVPSLPYLTNEFTVTRDTDAGILSEIVRSFGRRLESGVVSVTSILHTKNIQKL